jgi:hypothetical protein
MQIGLSFAAARNGCRIKTRVCLHVIIVTGRLKAGNSPQLANGTLTHVSVIKSRNSPLLANVSLTHVSVQRIRTELVECGSSIEAGFSTSFFRFFLLIEAGIAQSV